MGTQRAADGAVVGKHKVTYTPPVMNFPEGKEPKPGESPPRSGFEGLVPKVAEVEVKPGPNTIDIELVCIDQAKFAPVTLPEQLIGMLPAVPRDDTK